MSVFPRHPSSTGRLLDLQAAYDLIEQDRLAEAIDRLNNILMQAPHNAKAWAYRGRANGRLGNITAALDDLQKSVRIEPTAPAYFNLAVLYVHSRSASDALAMLLRSLQLDPNQSEASAMRERLAFALGLAELDRIARVAELFMYSRCGPGVGWLVEIRHMVGFAPNSVRREYDAVILDLRQQPRAFIQIYPTPPNYTVEVSCERPISGVPGPALAGLINKIIPARRSAVLEALNEFVQDGTLIPVDNCMRCGGEKKPH